MSRHKSCKKRWEKLVGAIDSQFQELDKKFGLIGRIFEDLRNAWKEKDTTWPFCWQDFLDIEATLKIVAQSRGDLPTMKLQIAALKSQFDDLNKATVFQCGVNVPLKGSR